MYIDNRNKQENNTAESASSPTATAALRHVGLHVSVAAAVTWAWAAEAALDESCAGAGSYLRLLMKWIITHTLIYTSTHMK